MVQTASPPRRVAGESRCGRLIRWFWVRVPGDPSEDDRRRRATPRGPGMASWPVPWRCPRVRGGRAAGAVRAGERGELRQLGAGRRRLVRAQSESRTGAGCTSTTARQQRRWPSTTSFVTPARPWVCTALPRRGLPGRCALPTGAPHGRSTGCSSGRLGGGRLGGAGRDGLNRAAGRGAGPAPRDDRATRYDELLRRLGRFLWRRPSRRARCWPPMTRSVSEPVG